VVRLEGADIGAYALERIERALGLHNGKGRARADRSPSRLVKTCAPSRHDPGCTNRRLSAEAARLVPPREKPGLHRLLADDTTRFKVGLGFRIRDGLSLVNNLVE